jgi:hypothetical protein
MGSLFTSVGSLFIAVVLDGGSGKIASQGALGISGIASEWKTPPALVAATPMAKAASALVILDVSVLISLPDLQKGSRTF